MTRTSPLKGSVMESYRDIGLCSWRHSFRCRCGHLGHLHRKSTGAMATGTASITLDGSGNTITGTLTNTSPFDARITGFGFDIGPGNLAGYVERPTRSFCRWA